MLKKIRKIPVEVEFDVVVREEDLQVTLLTLVIRQPNILNGTR